MTPSPSDTKTATLDAVLRERAATHPDALAFAHEAERLTYGQLYEQAGAIAAGLIRAGVRSGDRVALILPAGLDFARCFWAVQRAGAVSVAFNPYVPAVTAVRRAARARPALTLVSRIDDDFAREASIAGLRCLALDDVRGNGDVPPAEAGPESFAFFQPTSGTSGESRLAMIRQRNVMAVLRSYSGAYRVDGDDVLVSWVPPWHDLGLVRFIIGTIFNGAQCHIVTPSIQTLRQWLETISRAGGTISGAPDFAYRLAARFVDPSTIDLSSLRWMTNGGEPVRQSTIEAFETRFGCHGVVCPGYGLAEATLGVTFADPGRAIRVDDRGNVGCGKALPGVEVKIDAGEILVRGNGVFAGYFDAEESTAETLRDGWLHTGDIGHLDADGELFILGRRRAMLKRGGAVLAPRELEEAAQNVAGVRIAAAVGIARADATEEIVLAIELDAHAEDRDAITAAVAQEVQRTLGFAPDRVVVLPPRGIPRTYNGKIRHDALRQELERSLAPRGA
ncbi:MAG: AMP-binding protein [Acidobacteriota bacterium]|nr:AMP-binding protein [Acidobacteriota bacterium]